VTDSPPRHPRLRWWREVLYVLVFYGVYSAVRNAGVKGAGPEHAFHNARRIIAAERALHIFVEHGIQEIFLRHARWLVWIADNFYGSAHFIVTIVALVYCFRRMPERYPLWRNTLACMTALALLGFAFFPLLPPRLLYEFPSGVHYHFVDTLKSVGGLWNFDSGAMQKVSNQYAAMPSLHFGWSSWCAFVLYPALRHRWSKALMVAYPFITLFVIVVTANHFILDAAGGVAVFGGGYLVGREITRRISLRTPKAAQPAAL
jgi:hypothetical protein